MVSCLVDLYVARGLFPLKIGVLIGLAIHWKRNYWANAVSLAMGPRAFCRDECCPGGSVLTAHLIGGMMITLVWSEGINRQGWFCDYLASSQQVGTGEILVVAIEPDACF